MDLHTLTCLTNSATYLIYYRIFLLAVFKIGGGILLKNGKISSRLVHRRTKVEGTVISALDRAVTENLALVSNGLLQHLNGDLIYLLRGYVLRYKEIKTRLTAHRTEVQHAVRYLGITDVGSEHMLQGVHCGMIHKIPRVRLSGTQIVGHDAPVHTGNIDSLVKRIVIYGKALYSVYVI